MAKRPTTSTIGSGFYGTTQLNNNFSAINTAFDNTLSRDGSAPNSMNADIDMNNNDILNVSSITATGITLNGVGITPTSVAATPAASAITITDAGGYYAATDVEAALQEVQSDVAALSSVYQPLNANLTTLASNITAAGQALVDDATVAAQRTTLGVNTAAELTSANLTGFYSEGTYTATITTSTGSITLDPSFDDLQYTKIGKMVHIWGFLSVQSVSTPTGYININLPFTSANPASGGSAPWAFATVWIDFSAGTENVMPSLVLSNSTTFRIGESGVGDSPAASVAASDGFRVSFLYTAAS